MMDTKEPDQSKEPIRLASFMTKHIDMTLDRQYELKEGYIVQYLAATGASIEDLELCERREGITTTWFLRPKTATAEVAK